MDTQYRKNLKAVLTASKDYTDNSIEKLKWELGTYDLSVTTDSTVAYTKTIPTNTIKGRLNYIGGASKVSENLIDNPNTQTTTSYAVTFTPQGNGTYKTSGTATGRASYEVQRLELTAGTYTLRDFGYSYNNNIGIYGQIVGTQTYCDLVGTTTGYRSITITETCTFRIVIDVRSNIDTSGYVFKPMLVKGSTAPTEFKEGFENIRSAKTTSVKFEGANLLQESISRTSQYTIRLGNVSLKANTTYRLNVFKTLPASRLLVGSSVIAFSNYGFTGNNSFTVSEDISGELRLSGTYTTDDTPTKAMLNYGSTALAYVPYTAPITKAIPSEIQALEGYGWGINENVYNYIDFENKKFIQKVGRVDLGSLIWALSGADDNARFITLGIGSLILKGTTNLLCTKYTAVFWDNLVNSNDDMIIASRTSDGYLGIRNLSYTDTTTFKTAMSGIYLYYELATPIETDISQYIDDDFKNIDTTNMGTITFENEFEYDVPSEIDYLIEEVKA